MPLKPRTTAPAGSRSRVLDDAPIVSRDRPETELEDSDKKLEEPLLENDTPVVDKDDVEKDEVETNNDPATNGTAPSADKDKDQGDEAVKNSTPSGRRTRRATGVSTAPAPDGVDPKARLSEIQRDLKQLRSEYTAELKSLEAHYNEKLKALRSEHDLLTTQLTEATFTL